MAFAISRNRSNASITIADAHRFPEVGVPWFWPLAFAQAGLALTDRTLKFLAEVARTQVERPAPRGDRGQPTGDTARVDPTRRVS